MFHQLSIFSLLRGNMETLTFSNASFPSHPQREEHKSPAAMGAVLRPRLRLPAQGLHPPRKPPYGAGNSGVRKNIRQTTQHGFSQYPRLPQIELQQRQQCPGSNARSALEPVYLERYSTAVCRQPANEQASV